MTIIASIVEKSATMISCKPYRWVHRDSWSNEHKDFAQKKSLQFDEGLIKPSWQRFQKFKLNQSGILGFFPVGQWVLENSENQAIIAYASLEWDKTLFDRAWILLLGDNSLFLDQQISLHPKMWFIDFVLNRLAPDSVMIQDLFGAKELSEFTSKKLAIPNLLSAELQESTLFEITKDNWTGSPASLEAAKDHTWIHKTVEREQKEIARLKVEKKKPFLVRLLASMSPFRKQRREKMIHPLKRYKYRP